MPLVWRRNHNPYRMTYFSLLELGPAAPPGAIPQMRKKIAAKMKSRPHLVAGRPVSEAEITEAESRLLDEQARAWEVLLVHPLPSLQSKRLQQICHAIAEEAPPKQVRRVLRLANPLGLAAFLPEPQPEDFALPAWEELGVLGPQAPEDRRLDIQFDL
jgi:hypothetical protein